MNFFGGGDESQAQASARQPAPEAAAEGAEPVEAGANAPEASAGSKVGNMKAGDYLVHVHIQYIKNVHLEGEETCDPMVKVECLGKYKCSTAKNDVTQDSKLKIDEHLFLDFKQQKKTTMEEANIQFKIENKGFFKGDLIGQFEMAISKIYNMKKHVMQHQTIGLNNPNSDDFSKVTGYLTISVNVQGPGDEATELKMGTEKDFSEKAPLMPSSVKKTYKQIYLRVFRAEDLPIMDTNFIRASSIDAYMVLKYGTNKLKTKVVTMQEKKVDWMEEMKIPVEIPTRNDTIQIQVWDRDDLVDELCCSLSLNVKAILKHEGQERSMIKWINLYGAHNGYTGSASEKMNKDPSIASSWKGRILVEYFCEDVKHPLCKRKDITDREIVNRVMQHMSPRDYQIVCELGQGISLPEAKDYKLKLQIGKRVWESGSSKAQASNSCRWNKRFDESFQDSYQTMKRFPWAYVYLMDGDYPVCYWKESLYDFLDPTMPMRWFSLDPDPSVGYVKQDFKAGFFSMRLFFNDVTVEGKFDPNDNEFWAVKPAKEPPKWKIRANIYQCESLPPADSNGTSDPYIELWSPDDQIVRTENCEDTNNPIYYETKEIVYEFEDIESAPPVLINIFDFDEGLMGVGDSQEYIGRAVIFLKDLGEDLSTNDDIPYPQWYPVKRDYSDVYNDEQGAAILCSFQVVPEDQDYLVPAEEIELEMPMESQPGVPLQMPSLQSKEFKCEVMVLGLRDLESGGLLPVKKAYVKFNLKSLLPPAQAKAVANIQTQPKSPGPNPSIRTTLQFEIKIPEDPTFCPRMTCDVYDQLYFDGMAQPHVGTFTLKLGDVVAELRAKDDQFNKDLLDANQIMQQIVDYYNRSTPRSGSKKKCSELVAEFALQAAETQSQSKQIENKVGLQILNNLKASGIKIPSGSALKGGKAPGNVKAHTEGELEEQKRQKHVQQQDTIIKKRAEVQAHNIKDTLGTNFRKQMELAHQAEQEQMKLQLEKERLEAQKQIGLSKDGFSNVTLPKYKYDERLCIDVEVDAPPQSLFMPIGYKKKSPPADSETTLQGIKHYRRYYPDELELVTTENGELLIESPFMGEKISRAEKVKSQGLLAGLFGSDSNDEPMTIKQVGTFKGILRCYNEELLEERKSKINRSLDQMKKQLQKVWMTQNQGKKWDFDWKRIDPEMNLDFADIEAALKVLRQDYIKPAGVEQLQIYQHLSNYLFDTQLTTRLNQLTKCKVRIYMLEGFNFAQKDAFSPSDPYLFIKSGKEEFNEQKNYQLDTASPQFYKCYDFIVDFPGCPLVEISAYDYDDFFGDDLIGTTTLDLDDRYFSKSWQAIEMKPIEYRDLKHPESTISQGVVKLWCEINQKDSKLANLDPINVAPEPVKDFEARLIIWKTKDIEMMDFEGTSDVYFRSFFDPDQDQSTDTHYRCQTGEASFNWRHKLPLKSKQGEYLLTVQAWDWDLISSNSLIGECQFDIGPMMSDATLTDKVHSITYNYYNTYLKQALLNKQNKYSELANEIEFESYEEKEEKFWLPLRRYDQESDKHAASGQVLCSLRIYPKVLADKGPQGTGREEPNNDPMCPAPEGRLELSLDPFKMLNQLIPAAMWRKIITMALCVGCAFLCAMMAPMIFSNIITKAIVG